MAVPCVMTQCALRAQDTINMIMLGHASGSLASKDVLLSGVGLGNQCATVCSITFCWGINSALDTIISQAHGKGDKETIGLTLNRARLLSFICFLPLIFFSMNASSILIWLGQDPIVSQYAQIYIRVYLPGFFFQIMNDCQVRFLNMQG